MAHKAIIRTPEGNTQIRNRIGVVETVFFQQAHIDARANNARYHRYLESLDEPYSNTFVATEEWKVIQTAHLTHASYLLIENLEGSNLVKILTDAERLAIESRIILVGFTVLQSEQVPVPIEKNRDMHSPARPIKLHFTKANVIAHLQIHSGENNRFSPIDLTNVMVRCAVGQARYRLTVYPV